MRRTFTIVRLTLGALALTAVALPPLIRLRETEEEVECARRRAVLGRANTYRWESRVCPRRDTPYLFSLNADSQTVVACPNGHGQQPIPFHRWAAVP